MIRRDSERLRALCALYLREPATISMLDGDYTLNFDPPLDAAEQATFAELSTMATGATEISRSDLAAIRPNLQALRDFRQLGRNAFLALTAAERDRRLYDAQTDTTVILLALLRD